MNILSEKLLGNKYDQNPFLYCLNPIKNALLMIEVLRLIRSKFKNFQVKCLSLEEYLEESIYKFIDGICKEEDINFMLLEHDVEKWDSLFLLAKFEMYKIM